jgi:thiamine-monophosphate kinase
MNEDKIIDFFKQKFPAQIGDDAAMLNDKQVISKDLLVEDIHFRTRYYDAESLAHKALHVNLSDMAAMGATPKYILLGIAMPKNYNSNYIDGFIKSFAQQCLNNNVVLIGGDTTASPDKLFISVTIIGSADKPVYRSTANVGDIIYVAGDLGHAHIGLEALERNIAGLDNYKQSFLRPNAKVQIGLELKDKVTAMMDISDGLYIDLQKLCKSSSVSAEIEIDNLKPNEDFINACNILDLDPISVQLMGGEDYGLLFTAKPDIEIPFKRIGKIISGNGEVHFDKEVNLKQKTFSHFGELQ